MHESFFNTPSPSSTSSSHSHNHHKILIMKLPAKPKSSPVRTPDEFPPPLIMFPRSKSTRASRSRDSRANPMFVGKLNNGHETNQEPSSPKVTCIGQVRVTRSNHHKQTKTTSSPSSFSAVRRSKLLRKIKPRWLRRAWRGRIACFRCDCYTKSEKLEESKPNQIKREFRDVIGAFNDEFVAESTPRNAFLLTRSRSAPYRINGEDDEMRKKVSEKTVVEEESKGVNVEENGEDEGSVNGDEEIAAKVKKPVNLSRCKSEPGRRGDKLFVVMSFSSSV